MKTESSQVLTELLDAGFPRTTLVSVTGADLKEISGAKMGHVIFHRKVQDKLIGLLSWAKCMKSSQKFNINPAAYYEVQMLVLTFDEETAYTSLHELYEAGIINSEEMKSLAARFPALYDYNAFIEQFPGRAEITLHEEAEDASVVLHHGVPELCYASESEREFARHAVESLLGDQERNQHDRQLAS